MTTLFLVLTLVLFGVYIFIQHKKKNGKRAEDSHSGESPFAVAKSYFAPNDHIVKDATFVDKGTRILSTWEVSVLNRKGNVIKTIPLALGSSEEYTIGRDSDCDIALSDRTVSGVHALLTAGENGCVIRDNESTNGLVIVSGKKETRYNEIPLSDGLVVYLGNSPIAFVKAHSRKEISFVRKKSSSEPDDAYADGYSGSTKFHTKQSKRR